MTEQEAIEALKDFNKQVTAKADGAYQTTIGQMACEVAVKALEEVQQYRAIKDRLKAVYGECDGLLETAIDQAVENAVAILEKHEGIDIGDPYKSRLLTDEDVDKWEAYKAIGTPEECRAAAEKQMAKKLVRITSTKKDGKVGKCPCCGSIIGEDMIWCDDCGQRILWEV